MLILKMRFKKKHDDKIMKDPTRKFDKDMLRHQIDAQEDKAQAIEKEILISTKAYARSITELKQKILQLDSLLADKNY